MEDIIAYIILFVFGFSILFAYQWRKTKKRELSISVQHYADAILEFLVIKQHGKNRDSDGEEKLASAMIISPDMAHVVL